MIKTNSNKVHKTSIDKEVYFNPFPGLRPFTIDENHLFFGREGQSDELLRKLSKNRFLSLVGASGSGKSSLIYCGLLPVIYGGFIEGGKNGWKVVISRPGNGPMLNLASSIVQGCNPSVMTDNDFELQKTITSTLLRSSSKGLLEAIRHNLRSEGNAILVVIDQFEELFRFKKSHNDSTSDNEAHAFVKLLIEAVSQTEVPIYVLVTMRSDFIGDCAQFPELTKRINDSHYLIPQMTRENLHDAITGPVAVGGGSISTRLVQELLNSVGDNPDQLPILQHALMRTWDYWSRTRAEDEPMDIKHYDAVGKMEFALSMHANEAFSELTEEQRVHCQRIFKALTEKGSDNRGIRRPTTVIDLARIADCSPEEVIKIVERFRIAGRSFLSPSPEIALLQDSIIDISHESLMRVWDRLRVWVDEEAQSILMYLRLSEASHQYQLGKTGVWGPPDLQLAINWRDKQYPNLPWAERYDPAFERTMVFLQTSQNQFEQLEQHKLLQQKRALQRTRVFALVLGFATLFSLGFMLYAYIQSKQAEKQKSIAERHEKEALLSAKKSQQLKSLAELKEHEATAQKEKALRSAQEAFFQKENAIKSARDAFQQKTEAERQKQYALMASGEANRQKLIAENNSNEATNQRQKAESASQEASKLRMLSIAQSMAVKSLQVSKDTSRKALVALQAYRFNREFSGKSHNPDIYDGLYFSLKLLKGSAFNKLLGHKKAVRGLVYNKSGSTLYSTGSDGKIFKWTYAGGAKRELSQLYSSKYIYRSIGLNDDETKLVVATEQGPMQVLDISGELPVIKTYTGHKGAVCGAFFIPKTDLVITASTDSTVRVWDTQANTFKVIMRTESRVRSLAIDRFGKWAAAGLENGKVVLFDINNNFEIKYLLEDNKHTIYSIAFSHSGKRIALGDRQGVIRIGNIESMDIFTSLEGQNTRINDVKFSRDDKFIASASFDGSVQLWKMDQFNDQPIVLRDHASWVWCVAFKPDNEEMVTGCLDNAIRTWATSTEIMADQMCQAVDRNLNRKEWDAFIGKDIPYRKTCGQLPLGDGVKEEYE